MPTYFPTTLYFPSRPSWPVIGYNLPYKNSTKDGSAFYRFSHSPQRKSEVIICYVMLRNRLPESSPRSG